jgi:hypothetical protein
VTSLIFTRSCCKHFVLEVSRVEQRYDDRPTPSVSADRPFLWPLIVGLCRDHTTHMQRGRMSPAGYRNQTTMVVGNEANHRQDIVCLEFSIWAPLGLSTPSLRVQKIFLVPTDLSHIKNKTPSLLAGSGSPRSVETISCLEITGDRHRLSMNLPQSSEGHGGTRYNSLYEVRS